MGRVGVGVGVGVALTRTKPRVYNVTGLAELAQTVGMKAASFGRLLHWPRVRLREPPGGGRRRPAAREAAVGGMGGQWGGVAWGWQWGGVAWGGRHCGSITLSLDEWMPLCVQTALCGTQSGSQSQSTSVLNKAV